MRDFNLEQRAAQLAHAAMPWTWETWGPIGGVYSEPLARICPLCAALVVNEDGLLNLHLRTHGPIPPGVR